MSAPTLPYPATSEEFWACSRLAAAQLPPARLRALLAACASPTAAFALPLAELCGPAIALSQKQAARLAEAAAVPFAAAVREQAQQLAVTALTFQAEPYPANLRSLDDAPPILFVQGALRADDKFSVAVVGSRRATHYGRMQAERFAHAFVERGLVVVSGGAAGIDTAAHRGALAAGGRTIAVLGCGVDRTYPAENRSLFAQIAASNGAVVSEWGLGTPPEPWRFPRRNRIIAGMTRATVLVETAHSSGALITARNAGEYGRDVWVVPGPVDTGRSRGGHQLIQDGAALADAPEDVLSALGIAPDSPNALQTPPAASAASSKEAAALAAPTLPADLSFDETGLLAHLDLVPRHLDEAATATNLPAPQATVAATLLEMKGLVRRLPGNLYVRAL